MVHSGQARRSRPEVRDPVPVLDQRQHRSGLHERPVRVPRQRELQPAGSANVSGAAADSCARTAGVLHEDALRVGLRAGQVEAERPADAQPRACDTTSRSSRCARLDNPKFSDPDAYPVDKNNFAPRVGFAYSPGDHRSVVRGGYGLFYDKTHFELITGIITGGVFSDSFVPTDTGQRRRSGPVTRAAANRPAACGVDRWSTGRCSTSCIRRDRGSGTPEPSSSTIRIAGFRTRINCRSATNARSARPPRPAWTTCARSPATCS